MWLQHYLACDDLVVRKHLPASGLLFWHVNGLTLNTVTVNTVEPDERPKMVFQNVEGLTFDGKALSPETNQPPAGVHFLNKP